jgi:hypothetical protein
MKKTLIIPSFIFILSNLGACSSMTGSSAAGNLGGTHFYSLTSMPPSSAMSTNQISIGVGPVEIPRLLNRPQVVSRKNNTEIIMSENHQWGGSYKEELIKAITDNFSTLLKTEKIEQYPWKSSFKPDYQVRIDIESFDGAIDKSVTLNARWRLLKNGKELLVKRALIEVPVKGSGYNVYVNAQSEAITRFSREVVEQIRKRN